MNIGLNHMNVEKTVQVLKAVLADETLLYQMTKNAHWNIEGPDFLAMHSFFQSQYEVIDEKIDAVAERIRSLGMYAPGTYAEMLKNATLKETEINEHFSAVYIKLLSENHECLIREIRAQISKINDDYGDVGTADFLTGILEEHEKMVWMLRAHLK